MYLTLKLTMRQYPLMQHPNVWFIMSVLYYVREILVCPRPALSCKCPVTTTIGPPLLANVAIYRLIPPVFRFCQCPLPSVPWFPAWCRRCHPTGVDTDPASVSSGPRNALQYNTCNSHIGIHSNLVLLPLSLSLSLSPTFL